MYDNNNKDNKSSNYDNISLEPKFWIITKFVSRKSRNAFQPIPQNNYIYSVGLLYEPFLKCTTHTHTQMSKIIIPTAIQKLFNESID